jgi:hypothetical protein
MRPTVILPSSIIILYVIFLSGIAISRLQITKEWWDSLNQMTLESHIGLKSFLKNVLISKHIKFGFSEKATKFEKIFIVLLTRAACSVRETAYMSKKWRRFFKTNVDKSYYTNFTIDTQTGTLVWSETKIVLFWCSEQS